MPAGRLPKEDGKRVNRAPILPMTELELRASKVKVPTLPGARKFLPATRAWYATWSKSPQASQFTVTDWQRLHMLAPLVDAYYREPSARILAEIRLNEAKLGATAEDRLRLRWRMADTADAVEREERKASTTAGRKGQRRRRDPRLQLVKGEG